MDELSPEEQKYFETKGAVAPAAADGGAGSAAPVPAAEPESLAPAASDSLPAEPDAAEAESKPGPRENRRVPLGELMAERERRRNAETELGRARARLSAIESQLAILGEGGENGEGGALPDGAKDPEGYAKAVAARAERHKSALAQLRAAAEAHARRTEGERRLAAIYRAQAGEFEKRQPDFRDAYRFLHDDRDQELAALGYEDPVARAEMLAADESAIVMRALSDGVNPAERIYAVARRRGFKPGGGDGARLRLAEKGQAASRSLGGAAGGAAPVVSPESLAALDDAAFAAATKGANWRRLWG